MNQHGAVFIHVNKQFIWNPKVSVEAMQKSVSIILVQFTCWLEFPFLSVEPNSSYSSTITMMFLIHVLVSSLRSQPLLFWHLAVCKYYEFLCIISWHDAWSFVTFQSCQVLKQCCHYQAFIVDYTIFTNILTHLYLLSLFLPVFCFFVLDEMLNSAWNNWHLNLLQQGWQGYACISLVYTL